ncbi:hypothetical protein CEXT_730091 [Caerostris extrusa]|uniref:Uncharacterized protein n=1 Tax=Caerostris extrusa TaxID=172846 RepID=A0AAV4NA32_CAEEX|nr:hypothetical protein CEXT_730091 [Caerostris extrusa]
MASISSFKYSEKIPQKRFSSFPPGAKQQKKEECNFFPINKSRKAYVPSLPGSLSLHAIQVLPGTRPEVMRSPIEQVRLGNKALALPDKPLHQGVVT